VTATDGDSRQTLAYSISGGADASKFTIDNSTGALRFVTAPNYEAPTDSGANNVYDVAVQVSDSNGGIDTQAIAVTVSNVNEAPTDLTLSANTVAENAANGTVVGTVTGTDVDAGETKSYTFTNSAGGRFAINRTTGVITVANGTLLNYEAATSHSVTVRVTDRGGLTYQETFTINLTNVNDAPTGTTATVTFPEDTSHTFTSANFGFSDADVGDSFSAVRIDTVPTAGRLTLSGVAVTAGQVVSVADLTAGNLVFTPAANANGTGYARLTFSVRDSATAYDPTPNTLTMNVTAVNDAPTDLSLSANTVAENAANGTVVGTVTGTDVDAGDTKSYTLLDSAGGRFAINRTTGVITVANGTLLNYEAATSHTVTVRVTDRGGLTYQETFTINLTNVNDAPTGTTATVTFPEDTSHTFTSTNFGFSDADAGDSFSAVRIDTVPTAGRLTLSGVAVTAGQVVSVADLTAGNLVFTPAANANGTGYARLTFSVRDSATAYDPTPNTLTMNVTAVNDAPTDLSLSANTVAENAANGTVVGTVTGTDVDAGDTKSYTLLDSAGGRFAINRTTGVITVANGTLLNYEAATSHTVTVRVTDRGGLTYQETFTINLTNVNDAPTGTTATVTFPEDTSHTFTSTNFGFSDADAGDSFSAVRIDTVPTAGRLTLSGVAVTAGQVVSVADLTAGNLVFTPAANANGTGYARLTFSVRDSATTYDPTPNTLTLNVTAVNDAPVLVVNSGSTVAEGGRDTIGSAELAVADVDHVATQLTYSIGTGPAHGRLELTTRPGVAAASFTQADIAANRLVYVHNGSETTSDSFTFTVRDRAGGALAATTVTLTITPVNDAPTIVSNGGGGSATINVAEHVSAVTMVGGRDADLPAQTLSYSVSGGVDQALFTIDAATGALSFTVPPDFSVPTDSNGDNVYVVQVRVTDTQGASVTQTLHITVTDVAESSVPVGLPPSLVPTTPPAVLTPTPVLALLNPVVSGPVIEAAAPDARFADGESGVRSAYQTTREAPFRPEELRRDEVSLRGEDGEGRVNDQPVPVPLIPAAGEDLHVGEQEEGRSPDVLSELLFAKLDAVIEVLEQAVAADVDQKISMTRIAAAAGVALSAGFVAWALRSTALAASLFAAVPVWQIHDPLPVLATHRRERTEEKGAQEDVAREG
jgi:VCBS repeat-containing protein